MINVRLEGLVVFRGVGELAVDEADEFHGGAETELFVAGTVDVLIEQILDPVFLEVEAGDELIVAAQGNLVLEFHAVDNGIDALLVESSETDAQAAEEKMTGVLGVVQVVGIIHDALDVALIVAHLHTGFKDVFHAV